MGIDFDYVFLMANRINEQKKGSFFQKAIHPEYRQVVNTYCRIWGLS